MVFKNVETNNRVISQLARSRRIHKINNARKELHNRKFESVIGPENNQR